MPTGRVPHHRDALGVPAILLHILVNPGQRLDHLHHDLRQRDRRAQGIVGHHDARAWVREGRCNERVVGFVQRPPITAVDKHHHRSTLFADVRVHRCRKHVQLFGRIVAVRDVAEVGMRLPRFLRGFSPLHQVIGMVGHQCPVVVLAVQPLGVKSGHSRILKKFFHIGNQHLLVLTCRELPLANTCIF